VPLKVIPPEPLVNVPKLTKSPDRVKRLAPGVNIAPVLMVSETQDTPVLKVTALTPVVAITTSSVESGATPPTQVLPKLQLPPVVVLVMVAPKSKQVCNKTMVKRMVDFENSLIY
jgi:hypothetical protein